MTLFLPVFILTAASLAALSSISLHLFWLELVWISLGAGFVFLFVFVDWRSLLNHRWIINAIYGLAAVLLVLVYFHGPLIRNVRSWLSFGLFNFEPVELAKIALILLYAEYFSRRHLSIARWKTILTSFIFFVVPAGLTVLQPDLGSAIVLFGIWFGFLLASGLPWRRIFIAAVALTVAGVIMWTYVLRDYQRARVTGFLYPERNVLGVNYSVTQSKIAIGSSGFWGKGYRQGSELQLGFLTEPSSDFILAAFIEEWGLLGGALVVGSFLWLIYGVLTAGAVADRNFEKFICLGAAMVWGVHFLLNAGSGLGLTPVVGVTFPFLSYGGSSTVTNFFLLSIVYAIKRRT